MKYAINIINFGDCSEARVVAGLARDAERAGWDGFFIWDHIAFPWPTPMVDPWIALAAAAMTTERIRLGALVTPLPRRRPWKVAREAVSLDRLSGGRLIVGVGLGITTQEFDDLGEETDLKIRAQMLDEGLEIMTGLWRGEPFSFDGQRYHVREAHFTPMPQQQQRIPIWVAAGWPRRAALRRAARWDGVYPTVHGGGPNDALSPDDVREIVKITQAHRVGSSPFDVTIAGSTPGDDPQRAADMIAPYREAGLTWWQESIHGLREDLDAGRHGSMLEAMRARILQGPPER